MCAVHRCRPRNFDGKAPSASTEWITGRVPIGGKCMIGACNQACARQHATACACRANTSSSSTSTSNTSNSTSSRPILGLSHQRVNRSKSRPLRHNTVASSAAGDGQTAYNGAGSQNLEQRLGDIAQQLTSWFPLFVVTAGLLALIHPPLFTWFKMSYITWGLAFTMLGMGFTLKISDFTAVFITMPWLLLLGLSLQFTVLPVLGYVFSRYWGLQPALAIGMCVLSSCPGGTASNIVAYIARGEMGLSIMMTTASTMAAIVATPLLTALLAGTLVPVNPQALFMSTLQVVLAPVMLGVFFNQNFPVTVSRLSKFSPFVATMLIALIVGSTLGHSAQAAKESGMKLFGAVFGLHASGFILGYGISKLLGLSEKICRTNSIEVGMQNATLGAVLAGLHFADPLVAAPCAVSSCTQSVMGSLLAAYWRMTTPDEEGGKASGAT